MSTFMSKTSISKKKKKLREWSNWDEEINMDLMNYIVVTVF